MPWRGPQYEGEFPSLGWNIVDWIEARFRVPDGPLAGQALTLTDEQVELFVRWYRIDDRGRFVYRRGSKRGPKGCGKSPEAALIALVALCGPYRFDGWDARGEPVGVPATAPLVQVAAVSEDQSQNTYGWIYELLRDSPVVDEERLDVGLTRVFTAGRPGVLEPVTASAGSREGQRLNVDTILDEPHLWLPSNGGKRLAAVIRRNAAKMGGRTWGTTNSFIIGQDSVAEDDWKAEQRGVAGVLIVGREAPRDTIIDDDESLRAGLLHAYGDSALERGGWVDIDRLMQECRDPATTKSDVKQFYLNWPVEIDLTSWLNEVPGAYDRCLAPELTLDDCEHIVGAVDMSLKYDNTAVLWAGRHPSGRVVVRARVFVAESGRIDYVAATDEIRDRARQHRPTAIVYDPRYLELTAQQLEDEGLPMLEFPQSPERMVPACGHLYRLIVGGVLAHDGDPIVAAHVAAAVRRTSDRGWLLSKGKSPRPIDACVAMAMACWELDQPAEGIRGGVAGEVDDDAYRAALAAIEADQLAAFEALGRAHTTPEHD